MFAPRIGLHEPYAFQTRSLPQIIHMPVWFCSGSKVVLQSTHKPTGTHGAADVDIVPWAEIKSAKFADEAICVGIEPENQRIGATT